MRQFKSFADNRLIIGCVYCGGTADSRDHVPSRTFLDRPYPENLPVVDACKKCNLGFSKDEEYFACLVEATIAGSTDPNLIRRPSVAKTLRRSASLRARLEASKIKINGQTAFSLESDRIKNVLLKLARGHVAYELNQPCQREPDCFSARSLFMMTEEVRNAFNEPHEQCMFGEVGSRGFQRLISCQSELDTEFLSKSLINDWVFVQDGNYRYIAIDDESGIVIRIVIAEFLGCEIAWLSEVARKKL